MAAVSVRDVALRAGVSVGTVSNVMNRPDKVSPATIDSVQRAIDELGFVRNDAARQLRAGSSRAIGLVILDVGNPYRYVDIRGRARVEPDPDYAFADRVGEKYGADLREHDGPGDERVVVTIDPENVCAVDMSA